tara:strand:- start:1030 stop:1434 length:405 start_codon:yes stop_codon:yes gene_type:complete
MNNGYFAIELDKQCQKLVGKYANMSEIVSDHVTLAYKPNNRKYNKLKKLIGKSVAVFFKEYRANDNIDALWVDEMFLLDSDKKIKRADPGAAHITLSLKKGFKPGDANSMFKKPTIKKKLLGLVEGKINYIRYN